VKRLATLLLVAFLAVPACSSADVGDAPAPAPSAPPDVSGVSYGPGATDEGLVTLLDARPVDSALELPIVTTPADRATLDAPTTFAFQPSATALRPRRPRAAARRVTRELAELFTLEGTAYAHGAPMNGEAFLLVFATSRDPHWLRVFLQGRSFAPSDAEWGRLAGAHESLSLTVTRAVFEEGRLTADGGPFVGPPIRFTIAP
jgi:hypothetical protein